MVVIGVAIGISSWAIYSSACGLVEGISAVDQEGQGQFNRTLLYYFIIISAITMVGGSFIHHYVTKRMLDPMQQLIAATKKMQQGVYPATIPYEQDDEMGELIHQYNVMVDHIQKTADQREKILTDLSHEIRTPLASLTGYLQALHQGVIEGDAALYESLHEQATRLTYLIEQLDQLKQIDDRSETSVLERTHVPLEQMIESQVHMFALQLEQKNTTIDVHVEPETLFVKEEALQQVLSNVIDNAIRYGIDGERIIITGIKRKETYTIKIAGKSNPLTKEQEQLVFDRFYRVDHSRNRGTGGSGLGLAIAKEIMDSMHGTIEMSSDSKVTTCMITIPLEPL